MAELRQQTVDHRKRLPRVSTAEEIRVIEHVIEVVQTAACTRRLIDGPAALIRGVESAAETSEKMRHGEIRFPIAVVDRRIEDHRCTRRINPPVAAPEVAMQERRYRPVTRKVSAHQIEKQVPTFLQCSAVTIAAREIELRSQAPLAEKLDPVGIGAVELRSAADGVVALEAELRCRHSMLSCELFAEQSLGTPGRARELDPFQRQERHRGSGAAAK